MSTREWETLKPKPVLKAEEGGGDIKLTTPQRNQLQMLVMQEYGCKSNLEQAMTKWWVGKEEVDGAVLFAELCDGDREDVQEIKRRFLNAGNDKTKQLEVAKAFKEIMDEEIESLTGGTARPPFTQPRRAA